MRKLFDLENPVFQLISHLVDLVVLGLTCMVCCVPVVTAGAAVTALFKAVYDLTLERGGGVMKIYFAAFRTNFRQATAAWLLARCWPGPYWRWRWDWRDCSVTSFP